MKDNYNYYCNCQADCIHKGKLKKVLQISFSKGRKIKRKIKVQLCKNKKNDCTCPYRVRFGKAIYF